MRRGEDKLELSREQMRRLIPLIAEYIVENFEIEPGNLQVEMLVDKFVESAGIYCYNKGVEDATAYMTRQVEDMFILMKDNKI